MKQLFTIAQAIIVGITVTLTTFWIPEVTRTALIRTGGLITAFELMQLNCVPLILGVAAGGAYYLYLRRKY